jgi:hypothetical protein
MAVKGRTSITEGTPVPRWHVGPRIWRVDGEWRLRLYRPWDRVRFMEAQSPSFIAALIVLGTSAGWWDAP